jgi:hypothetical protein
MASSWDPVLREAADQRPRAGGAWRECAGWRRLRHGGNSQSERGQNDEVAQGMPAVAFGAALIMLALSVLGGGSGPKFR